MNSAVFLDRDGVIIHNRSNYVREWKDVDFLPNSLAALYQLSLTRYKIVIITNQSAIGRGLLTMHQAEEINHKIILEINQAGGHIDGLFICPHTPDDHCLCRKPLPGLILQAAESLEINLSSSIMVGDAITDMQAGSAAGIKSLIMVKTGRGHDQLKLPQPSKSPGILIVDDLLSAVSIINSLDGILINPA